MKKILTFFLSITIIVVYTQDLHLSQFYTNKINLNPSLSGNYKGAYQLTGNHRNQWREIGSSFNSNFFSFDKKMHHYSNEYSIGLLFADDQFSGFNQKTTKFLLNASYTAKINTHVLRGGVQLGMIFRKTDLSSQTFPNQWEYQSGEFNQSVSNGELNLGTNQNSLDASLGFSWTKQFNKLKPTIGIALFHFNRPKDSYFVTHTERLRTRKVISSEIEWTFNKDYTLQPKLLYMWTTKSQDLVIGSNISKKINNNLIRTIYAGMLFRTGFFRNNDAFIPVLGTEIDKFNIGLSYDLNISTLSAYNSRKSAFELSIIYTTPMYNPSKLSIPCDRL